MPTIVDSLIVTLGLDPTKFTQGQKDALAAFKRTKESATTTAKELEARGKQGAEFFTVMRNSALKFLSVVGGVGGIMAFVKNTVFTEAAVGRLSRNLNLSTEALSSWQGAAKLAGGSAEGMAGSMQSLVQGMEQAYLTGTSNLVPVFRSLGILMYDIQSGKARPVTELLLDLADAFHKLPAERAIALGSMLGLDPGTISLLQRGRGEVKKYLDQAATANKILKDQADASEELQFKFNRMIDSGIGGMRKWVAANKTLIGAFMDIQTMMWQWETGGEPGVRGAKGPRTRVGKISHADLFGNGSTGKYGTPTSILDNLKSVESSGKADAIGPKIPGMNQRAQGAYQFLPSTRDMLVKKYGYPYFELNDPVASRDAADFYLQKLHQQSGGDWNKALADYGGFKTQDPSKYQSQVLNGARGNAKTTHQSTSSSTSEIHIGQIVVNTQATDAKGIARDLGPALKSFGMAAQANTGLN